MSVDDVYKKQLEKFGIESTRVVKVDLSKALSKQKKENNCVVTKLLMESGAGREWIYDILDLCRVFTTPFSPGQPDMTHLLCGAQAVGHKILKDVMDASPEKFYIMTQEESARREGIPESDDASDLV